MTKLRDRLDFLFRDAHPASLGLFRIIFGLVMLVQIVRFKPYILHTLPNSRFHFKYDLFTWVDFLPPGLMSAVLVLLIVAASFVVIGLFSRISSIVLFLGFSYIFLLDQGHYNNHFYLFILLSFLLCFSNADKWGSVRAWLDPEYAASPIPYWQIFMLQAQIFIVYFYGGIAKLNPDWLAAMEMKLWLPGKSDIAFIDSFLSSDFGAYFMAYTGLIFDLCIGFLLFWKKTRAWALIPVFIFHLSNHFLWNIGLFPYAMIGTTGIFFAPDWPQKWLNKLFKSSKESAVRSRTPNYGLGRKAAILVLSLHFAFQLLFPLRRYFYGGNTAWHGQGHLFSWRMMMGDQVDQVRIRFNTPDMGYQYVSIYDYISNRQLMKCTRTPKNYLKFAHALADTLRAGGIAEPEISMEIYKSVNGRPWQLLIDPELNLAKVEYSAIRKADWILPMKD